MVAAGVTARPVDRRPRRWPTEPDAAREPGVDPVGRRDPGRGAAVPGRGGLGHRQRPDRAGRAAALRRRRAGGHAAGGRPAGRVRRARWRRRPRCGRPGCRRCPTAPSAGARRSPRPRSTPCSTPTDGRPDARPTPLLLVGHGTVDATGVAEFVAFTERLRRAAGRRGHRRRRRLHRAGPAHRARGLGAARRARAPPAGRGADGAGRGRAREGRHPGRAAARGAARPGQRLRVRPPARPAPGAAGAAGRADRRRAGPRRRPTDTAVLLVGRGSTDPDANAEVCKVARLLQEGRPYDVRGDRVRLAGRARTCPPGWPAARALGARRIVVAPVLPVRRGAAAPGRCTRPRAFAAEHPELDVRTAGYLGDCRRAGRAGASSATGRRCTATSG